MTPTKKIKFLIDVEVENQGKVSFKAKAGEVKELSASSANRWLRRNKAKLYIQSVKPSVQDKPSPPEARSVTGKQPAPKKKANAKAAATKTVNK